MQSLLATGADIDFAHDREVERVNRSSLTMFSNRVPS